MQQQNLILGEVEFMWKVMTKNWWCTKAYRKQLLISGPSLPFPALLIDSSVVNATAAEISWIIPNISYTPESYFVYYFKDDSKDTMRSSYSVHTSEILEEFMYLKNTRYSVFLTNLIPNTTYWYHVISYNSEGNISSSMKIFVTGKISKWQYLSNNWF